MFDTLTDVARRSDPLRLAEAKLWGLLARLDALDLATHRSTPEREHERKMLESQIVEVEATIESQGGHPTRTHKAVAQRAAERRAIGPATSDP